MRGVIFLLLVIFAVGCSVSEDQEEILNSNLVDYTIEDYVDRFKTEAHSRGIDVDLSELDIIIQDEKIKGQYCGYGYSKEPTTGNPTIMISQYCWDQLGHGNVADLKKEIFIFHELGHAILKRRHVHQQLPDGSPKSIMTETLTFDYAYDSSKRIYYLSELFNPTEPVPVWAMK